MTFSELTTETCPTSQLSSRNGRAIDMVILHHSATTNTDQVLSMMKTVSRRVSSNYVVKDRRVVGVVPEESRAWTSGSTTDGGKGAAFDTRAITFEIQNERTGDPWPVSDQSHETVAQLVADLHRRYGIPLDRDHVVGHRELFTRWQASYPTACPGALDVGAIVNRAKELVKQPAPTKKPAVKPAAALRTPGFPLPRGYYFGPKAGPVQSVSGYYSHRADLKRWQQRMHDRGWTIGVDGLYGPNTQQNTIEFQREKGLTPDGLIGPKTWAAAWTEPVT